MVSKSDGMVRQTCSQVASVCSRFNIRAVRPRSDWHHTDTAIHHRWADGSLPIKSIVQIVNMSKLDLGHCPWSANFAVEFRATETDESNLLTHSCGFSAVSSVCS